MESFTGFPYLVTRVFPGLYDLTLYPATIGEPQLIEWARA